LQISCNKKKKGIGFGTALLQILHSDKIHASNLISASEPILFFF
jgi:hypothetical protein